MGDEDANNFSRDLGDETDKEKEEVVVAFDVVDEDEEVFFGISSSSIARFLFSGFLDDSESVVSINIIKYPTAYQTHKMKCNNTHVRMSLKNHRRR